MLAGVASTPGFLLYRIGLLLLGTSLWPLGAVIVSIGAVLHITASSSVRVVKMSLRLHRDQQEPRSNTDRTGRESAGDLNAGDWRPVAGHLSRVRHEPLLRELLDEELEHVRLESAGTSSACTGWARLCSS
jgi:hypothetical protein